ncbi:MAG: hypothetical protein M3Z66_19160, partial [Chloroflexota bacterium]|nr:hypothetical protein [Chloroflexota bacterium]
TAVIFSATPQSYSAVSIPNAHQLFAVNREGTLDIYKIAADGLTLSLQTSTPSQVYTPDGAASGTVSGTTFDFSGQFVSGPAGVEAHTLNTTSGALGPVPGSPQTDPLSNDGENVHFAPGLNLVTQTQFDCNSVGAYGITGGSLHFVNTTQLDSSASGPQAQTSISRFLLVENIYSHSISACRLATSGVSGCVLVATLTTSGQSLFPAGIGAISAQ